VNNFAEGGVVGCVGCEEDSGEWGEGWVRYVTSVDIPYVPPPPPRRAQNRSGYWWAFTVRYCPVGDDFELEDVVDSGWDISVKENATSLGLKPNH